MSEHDMRPNSRSIELWIKIWGVALVIVGLSFIPVGILFSQWFKGYRIQWANVIIQMAYGFVLIFGKRIYAIWLLGLIFSFLWMGGEVALTFHHTVIEPLLIPRIYHLILALFYIAFFVFLLTGNVKEVFGPSPFPKRPAPTLTTQEEKRVKLWVRVVAIVMILESVGSSIFSDWYQIHGLPPGGRIVVIIETVASLGLLFLRPNIGRRFTLFV